MTHLQQQLSQLKDYANPSEDVMSFGKRMGWEAALQQFGGKRSEDSLSVTISMQQIGAVAIHGPRFEEV